MKPLKYILLIIFSILYAAANAQNKDEKLPLIELNGYIKDVQNVVFIKKIDSNASSNMIHNRLNFKSNFSEKFSARLEIRNRVFYGDQIKMTPYFGENINQYNGILNLSHLWINKKSIVVHSVIDRLVLKYSDEKWDVKIGRQRINWGVTNIWNPNDIFNAYNFLDFDYEERPGSDAIRINRNLTTNSAIELAYEPNKSKDESTAALLYKFNTSKYDFQVLSGWCQRDFVIGGGWAGNIKQAGFKGEFSYFFPKNNTVNSTKTFTMSLMADQTFKNDWYVAVSALYNSNPTDFLDVNSSANAANLSVKSLFPFRYNFYLNVMKTISPITSFSLSTIYAPKNNTLIFVPTFAWNVAENFDLDFTAQSFSSADNNSYQNWINSFYIRSRWSF